MIITGIDEAGIGCWAGPLVAVSTSFDSDTELTTLIRDSKRLSMLQRESLIDTIYSFAELVIIKVAPSSFINASEGIWSVWDTLIEELIKETQARMSGNIIVDGERMISSCKGVYYEAKADAIYREVSAASIVAKYVQTSAMEDLHDQFGVYGFTDHHGYGTALHRQKLEEYGPTSIHRLHYKPVAKLLCDHPDVAYNISQEDFQGMKCTTTILGKRK